MEWEFPINLGFVFKKNFGNFGEHVLTINVCDE